MCQECRMSLDDVIVPTVLPIGGFKPLMCCMCGSLLRGKEHVFQEGRLCNTCFYRLPPRVLKAAREWELEQEGKK